MDPQTSTAKRPPVNKTSRTRVGQCIPTRRNVTKEHSGRGLHLCGQSKLQIGSSRGGVHENDPPLLQSNESAPWSCLLFVCLLVCLFAIMPVDALHCEGRQQLDDAPHGPPLELAEECWCWTKLYLDRGGLICIHVWSEAEFWSGKKVMFISR